MKKLLGILVLGLLWCNVASGKISKLYYDIMYEACMESAITKGHSFSITKKYCTCSADHFNKNYDNSSLEKLVENEGGPAYEDVVNYVSKLCLKKVGLL